MESGEGHGRGRETSEVEETSPVPLLGSPSSVKAGCNCTPDLVFLELREGARAEGACRGRRRRGARPAK